LLSLFSLFAPERRWSFLLLYCLASSCTAWHQTARTPLVLQAAVCPPKICFYSLIDYLPPRLFSLRFGGSGLKKMHYLSFEDAQAVDPVIDTRSFSTLSLQSRLLSDALAAFHTATGTQPVCIPASSVSASK
jgi:hypothetical protein